jgi:hypothetical protein
LSDFRNQTITLTFDEQAKIQASDKQGSDFFGTVAISENGNTAIVGVSSPITGHAAGAAYIFTRSGTSWTQQQKIQASDKQQDDYFGSSVSISSDGNTALVGASSEDTGGSAAGAAYIFTRSGTSWTQRAKIQASDKQQHDFFGNSVSISSDGNTALVGATYEDTGGTNAGAAYIFARSGTTWSQQAKIQASDKQQNDVFGFSVSISSDGNTALVGAAYKGGYAGAAYIFTRSGTSWTQRAKIQASDKQGSDLFGYSASISGDGNTALVGAIYEDTGGLTPVRPTFSPGPGPVGPNKRKSRRRINKRATTSGGSSPSLMMETPPSWGRLERVRVTRSTARVPPTFSPGPGPVGPKKPRSRRRIYKGVTNLAIASACPVMGEPPSWGRRRRIRVGVTPVRPTYIEVVITSKQFRKTSSVILPKIG